MDARPTHDLRLVTERLVVRPWRDDEATRLLDVLGRVEVMKWLTDGEPVLVTELAEAQRRIGRYRELSAVPPMGFWAVELAVTGQALGSVLLLTLPNAEHGEVEIGWHLHPDSWGHGYATEAAAAVLERGFAAGLREINAVTHLDNRPSQGVARKLGMSDRGVVEKWYDGPSQLFVITAEEWRARTAQTNSD
jgi:RimJ/RimL family protein N-acetyltransferase